MCVSCGETFVRRTKVGQRTDPRYYMVKYSHTGLEQVIEYVLGVRERVQDSSSRGIVQMYFLPFGVWLDFSSIIILYYFYFCFLVLEISDQLAFG